MLREWFRKVLRAVGKEPPRVNEQTMTRIENLAKSRVPSSRPRPKQTGGEVVIVDRASRA